VGGAVIMLAMAVLAATLPRPEDGADAEPAAAEG